MTNRKTTEFSKLDRVIQRQRRLMYSSALVVVALVVGLVLLGTPLAA
jgi:hypothetical protein